MDPLSITASVLTLAGAGGKISKTLKKLVNLRDAPRLYQDLNNELELLRCTVGDVQTFLSQNKLYSKTDSPSSLPRILHRLKETLVDFESLISYELTAIDRSNKSRVDRTRWLRADDKIKTMLDRIREERLSLRPALELHIS